ncbi:hypothetical protein [Acinetobacter rongchengensis]|uniref:Uncharacterized protein n=1 Tax=Acinetobacter rongchengensis TaxID=2419601 RepID=A0A3A8F1G7_9GAMM|nr:hypothetical protein [Acinetobacter rongchengensis]RKG40847.1 hypothetical protein D7V20_00180 [Acinetobacter rongchengensis]
MKKVPSADLQVIESITAQLIDNVNLKLQTDHDEESKAFSLKITKENIREITGRRVVRDSVFDGYSTTIKEKFPATQISRVSDGIVISVPAYGAIEQPLTLAKLASENKDLTDELEERNSED